MSVIDVDPLSPDRPGWPHGIRCSPRQAEVLALIARGLTDKEIAFELSLSAHTVRTYLDRFMRDNQCCNRTAAAMRWYGEIRAGPGR